jgi:hypothetical protein
LDGDNSNNLWRFNLARDYTPYQQKVIKRYYDNQNPIAHQRLAELVGELYLSSGKKREKVWATIIEAMKKLEIAESRIKHLVEQDKPELLAQLVKELEAKN